MTGDGWGSHKLLNWRMAKWKTESCFVKRVNTHVGWGTTVDATMIPVCSLKSMTSNQVHALLHSDRWSWIKQHNKSNNKWQTRRKRLERTWGEEGCNPQYIWDDICFYIRSRVHGHFLSELSVDSNLTTSGSICHKTSRISFGFMELNNFVWTDA